MNKTQNQNGLLQKNCIDTHHNKCISIANDLLVTRQFNACLEFCLKRITDSKTAPENSSTIHKAESLCAIAIQAYAELDRWQEVLPFITQLYSGIEDCPSRIVRLCVLLHAYMRDYTTCSAVAHIWLRNPRNESSPSYQNLVEIYLTKVLIPQKKWKDVQPFLDSCQGLPNAAKEDFERQVHVIQNRHEEIEEINRVKEAEKQKEVEDTKRKAKEMRPSFPVNVACDIYEWLSNFLPKTILQFIARLTVVSFITYWLFSRGHLDFLSNSKLMNTLTSLMQMWRLMFAPFHLMKKT